MTPRILERLSARPLAGMYVVLLLFLAWRVFALASNGHDLFVDEAQYVVWAREPAAGYYSKPPMLAWLIAGAAQVCGEGETCVRTMATLLYVLAALVLLRAVKPVFGDRSATFGALAFIFAPLISLYGLFVSTDAPLILASALFVACALHAVRTGHVGAWIALGVVAGTGLLAKYSFGLLMLALGLFMLFDGPSRRQLLRPGPWLAALACIIVCAPNLAWNARHHFITLTHTAEISQLDRSGLHAGGLALFIVGQLLAFGPLASVLLLRHGRSAWRATAPAQRQALALLLTMGLLPLMFFSGLALLSRANLNWPMFAFVPLAAVLGHVVAQTGRLRMLSLSIALTVVILALVQHFPLWTAALGLKPAYRMDPFGRLAGWREASRQAQALLAAHPLARPLTESRTVAAELLYYAPQATAELAVWNPSGRVRDHYRLTRDIAHQAPGGRYLYFGEAGDPTRFAQSFDQVKKVGRIRVDTHRDHAITLDVLLLEGFHGYAAGQGGATTDPDD